MTSPAIERLRNQLTRTQATLLDEARRLQGRANWIVTAGGLLSVVGGGLISYNECVRDLGLWLLGTGVVLILLGTLLSNTISPLPAALLNDA